MKIKIFEAKTYSELEQMINKFYEETEYVVIAKVYTVNQPVAIYELMTQPEFAQLRLIQAQQQRSNLIQH